MPESKQIVVRLPTALYDLLKERSKSEERTVAQSVRLAIRQHLLDEALRTRIPLTP